MHLLKRLPVVVPLVLISQLIFAVGATAQPGNGLLPAGNYHITTLTAGYFACCGQDPSTPFLNVNVTDTTTVANLAGASTTTHETDVSVNACGGPNFICGGARFITDNASDFTITGLSSAALKTSFDPATAKSCQPFPFSLDAFTLDVVWTGTNPVGTTRKSSAYTCAGYSAAVETLDSNDNATAGATFSLFGSSAFPAESGGLGNNDQRWHTQGIAQDACSPIGLGGGGKGTGPGPTGSGGFEFANQGAGLSFPGGFVGLFDFTMVSRPIGAAPSTVGETELTVASFAFPNSFFLCFALQPPMNTFAFGSGLSSATVHAVIDSNTPPCIGFTNGPFDPFTVDVTWSATGPQASIRSTGISDCGAFHQVLTTADSTNPATASGNVSLFGDISTPEASINSSDHRFQDTGSAPQGCILRP